MCLLTQTIWHAGTVQLISASCPLEQEALGGLLIYCTSMYGNFIYLHWFQNGADQISDISCKSARVHIWSANFILSIKHWKYCMLFFPSSNGNCNWQPSSELPNAQGCSGAKIASQGHWAALSSSWHILGGRISYFLPSKRSSLSVGLLNSA